MSPDFFHVTLGDLLLAFSGVVSVFIGTWKLTLNLAISTRSINELKIRVEDMAEKIDVIRESQARIRERLGMSVREKAC